MAGILGKVAYSKVACSAWLERATFFSFYFVSDCWSMKGDCLLQQPVPLPVQRGLRVSIECFGFFNYCGCVAGNILLQIDFHAARRDSSHFRTKALNKETQCPARELETRRRQRRGRLNSNLAFPNRTGSPSRIFRPGVPEGMPSWARLAA
ncbi:hypothetical protein GXB81_17410 [Paraburkholderia sp. Ac-20336]|uniref:hypothetical protein n=1 Tax=unclassified Paraburkholderia TaxID=2615204 RepID=UPI00142112ED|nr:MULTISPECIES: hypothetical protein [unclassified Paraburkholderia]MBN3804814.1 hypothetical protein [Paraburkholderia sp. Ac-20336]MBN3845958.1 hypothetical protein [Paraburkholderia sp. Ac-20342]NIF77789.1 hypothetical protein [Paraburkholderia sp. Cy-641]